MRASCQSRAPGATVVLMPDDNFRSQVPAASALFLREAEVRRGIEYLFFGHAALWRDRKSVVSGKSVSVRVDLGGRRILNNKKTLTTIELSNITTRNAIEKLDI